MISRHLEIQWIPPGKTTSTSASNIKKPRCATTMCLWHNLVFCTIQVMHFQSIH
ncbi:hypothetical protein KP509_06G082200 [Ceratopteris richardii]|uniref:Uncharacterized protein n=1 Tax=Ceratopteris richardii TaxID=49495 RepID=A0A8T2UQM5_CERRI|nr:hypothetical protein KP509_06G082200 [Ceratopteris richardii]